jgi:protein-tyrosine-phosphatase
MPETPHVLVLCHGNKNRSPACEAVLKAEGINAVSAGFKLSSGVAAKKTRDFMTMHGYSLDKHKTMRVTDDLVRWAHVIIIMDGGNEKRLKDEFGEDLHYKKVLNLGAFVGLERIPDPGFMPKDGEKFKQTMRLVITASRKLARYLKS